MRIRAKALLGGLVVLLVAVAGFGGWLLRGSGDGVDDPASLGASGAAVQVGVPTIVSIKGVEAYAAAHAPLYWAGPQADARLEAVPDRCHL